MASTREITFVQALNEALDYAMSADKRVVIMGEDVGVYGGVFGVTMGLYDKYGPERVRDTPIAESGFIGAAVGAAMMGLRPVVELMFIDFLGVAFDQIYNQAAKLRYMTVARLRSQWYLGQCAAQVYKPQPSTPNLCMRYLPTCRDSRWLCHQHHMMPKVSY